jgi:putative tryptophan/tyrosine transport system substrate-binding protein
MLGTPRYVVTRRSLLQHALVLGAGTLRLPAHAAETRRLGVLTWLDPKDFERERPGIFAALAETGWSEGRNLSVAWAQSRVDSPDLERVAAELVSRRPDAILTENTPNTRALARATSRIPIVTSVGDPIASGFAATIPRPGGNITGLCNVSDAFESKCIELLKAISPQLKRIVAFAFKGTNAGQLYRERSEEAAAKAAVKLDTVEVQSLADTQAGFDAACAGFDAAFRAGARAALIGIYDPASLDWLAEALPRHGVPALVVNKQGDTFLLSYEQYHSNAAVSLATILDKVLRGRAPAEIPFAQVDAAHLVLNRRIADRMKLRIPDGVLLQVTRFVG